MSPYGNGCTSDLSNLDNSCRFSAQDQWNRFRQHAFGQIVRDWCEENSITLTIRQSNRLSAKAEEKFRPAGSILPCLLQHCAIVSTYAASLTREDWPK